MSIAQKLLSLLPPEAAHKVGKWAMRHRLGARGQCETDTGVPVNNTCMNARYELFGTIVDNPLGLAAGFDKNGELVDVIEDYGFGFMEVGSVTLRGGKGNPKPRMFRLPHLNDIMNRMGLNGDPAVVVAERLRQSNIRACVDLTHGSCYGINIAKTHDPQVMGDAAIRDIVECYKELKHHGIYHVFNISCPNTLEGKTFEDPAVLKELLAEAKRAVPGTIDFKPAPRLVKLSPMTMQTLWEKILDVCRDANIDGYVMCNTIAVDHPEFGKGGLSGSRVKDRALKLIEWARLFGVSEPIIACGGIFTGQDLLDYKAAGANFFQAYNGFVRGPNAGPTFACDVLSEAELLEREP